MQYRFGMLGKIELQYPSEKADSRSHFSEGAEVYAESIISHLAFSTGNYKYVIYDMMFTNFPDPKRNDLDKFPTHNSYDGVLVYKSNGLDESLIKVIQCRHKAVSAPLPEGSLRWRATPRKRTSTLQIDTRGRPQTVCPDLDDER